ncbi:50S ribosomal protein L15P [Thermogladius calderae 1633]|uniref:Large ribosomal subunit protein uL15 n=1 Tax=Thermogladius calderae (strain DSM 22663 / VKM B-2946 / 1633) TaxID=1184251 RepID=I3TDD5_THEC1|nr:uL15 family ribosomal protein [Thermogladius calderae]AFK50773.1 50S ribosomal protein L15P [Thermogladius calderae 1633]
MAVRKRKKSRKLRGRTRTMGWGRVGQHRKSGSRGGFGAVGMHKHKWVWMLKYAPDWYGKHGFVNPTSKTVDIREINVGLLDEIAEKLVREGKAVVEGDLIVIDVTKLGFNKVTGSGKVTRRMKIIAEYITENAKKKVEEAGGLVQLLE